MSPPNLPLITSGDLVNIFLMNSLTQEQVDGITAEIGDIENFLIQNIKEIDELKLPQDHIESLKIYTYEGDEGLVKRTWYGSNPTVYRSPLPLLKNIISGGTGTGAAVLIGYVEENVHLETLLLLGLKNMGSAT